MMKFAPMTKRPELATSYPENADEHANLLMKEFDDVNLWLQQNQGQYLEETTQRIERNIALGVKQGVASGLEEVSYGIRKAVDEAFVQEVVDREVSKELAKGLGLGVPKLLFDQLYKSYEELYASLGAKYESARGSNLRLHQHLPKRLPRANFSPYSSRNVSDKLAGQKDQRNLWSDDGGTRGWRWEPSEDSEVSSEISEEQKEGSSDTCCVCGTPANEEELTITTCCSKFVGSLCFEEALQETGKCCLCQRTQNIFESPKHDESSEQDQDYKFHFVDVQSQAEDSRKDKSVSGVANQSETGVACPPWKASPPCLVPETSAEPLKCLRETNEWAMGTPEARGIQDLTRQITRSFSNPCSEPSEFSHEDSSIYNGVQLPDPQKYDPNKSLTAKEYEFVLRLSDQAVISYLKHLSRDDVLTTVSEALEKRLSTTIHKTSISGILLLENGDIQFKYKAKKSRGPDLEDGAASLAQTLEIFVRARLKPYLVVMHNIEIKSMNLCSEVQRTRVIEELMRFNTNVMQHLSRPDDIRTIRWTTDEKRRRTVQVDSVTLGLATAAQANEVIARGLSWKGTCRYCAKYVPKQKFVQCYNCQKFGHVGKTCTSLPRCRACAGCHQTSKCPLGRNASTKNLKCALCGGPHCANDYYCPVRSGEEIRLQTENRFYPTNTDNGTAASATLKADSFEMPLPDTTPLPVTPPSQVSKIQLYSKVGGKTSTEQKSYPVEDPRLRAGQLANVAAQQAYLAKALNPFDPVWQFDPPLKPTGVKPIINLPKAPEPQCAGP